MTRLQQAELCPTRESSDGLLLRGRCLAAGSKCNNISEFRGADGGEAQRSLGGVGAGLMRWGDYSGAASGGRGSAIYCPG